MSTILIKSGRVIDPASARDEKADVLIRDGKIAEVGEVTVKADEVIHAGRKIVCPGLVDMHVHLREPGNDEVETIASGAAAAINGGFTTVAAMPNTTPATDNVPVVEYVYLREALAEQANVVPIGAITVGRLGVDLAELAGMARAGVAAFSDDGDPVSNPAVMRRAMEYIAMLGKPLISHSEDRALSDGGVMHEGAVSVRLGLAGIPAESESIAVARDVALAEMTGCHLHVAHVSTAASVDEIRRAKARGVSVTAEVTTHHLTLTDECLLEVDCKGIRKFDTNYKMSPPLRSREDVEAVREGLTDGTIDCIVSDHAPHSLESKSVEFDSAPFGIIGLETTLAVLATELVAPGIIDWPDLIAALSTKPAAILDIPKGTLEIGADADVTVIDPDHEWTIDAAEFLSKSTNTPYHGKKVKGRAVAVVVDGAVKLSL